MPEHKEAPKHFMDGFEMTNDTELVQEVYRRFDENSRLNKSQSARVEFLTTVKCVGSKPTHFHAYLGFGNRLFLAEG